MPRATVDQTETSRHDLQSLPEGYVVLRKLSYGQMLQRQEMAAEMAMKGDGRGGRSNKAEATIKMMQTLVTEYEFKNCIVEHNLEDENGQNLNFQQPGSIVRLDPRIGDEVSQLIDKLNQFNEVNLEKSEAGSEQ